MIWNRKEHGLAGGGPRRRFRATAAAASLARDGGDIVVEGGEDNVAEGNATRRTS